MERLFLIGYMGAGKTTFGKMLAKAKGLGFIDLDLYIENRYQKSIGKLYEEFGNEKFREIENELLKEVAGFENVVISTGGGTPCYFDSIDKMNKEGMTVYLKSSPEDLFKRLNKNKDKRPLLRNKSSEELLEFITVTLREREYFYNQANIIVDIEEFPNADDKEKLVLNLVNKINTY